MFDLCFHLGGWRYVYDDDDDIVGRTCIWCKKTELF